jgi:hypothetical protein
MFIKALFGIAKIWNHQGVHQQIKCIKKMCYISTMEYASVIKKEEICHCDPVDRPVK